MRRNISLSSLIHIIRSTFIACLMMSSSRLIIKNAFLNAFTSQTRPLARRATQSDMSISRLVLDRHKFLANKQENLEQTVGFIAGTNLRILKYPDPRLRADNKIITDFDKDLGKLIKELFLVMYATGGIGLAAPQVGVNLRLLVFNKLGKRTAREGEFALVNPKIVNKADVEFVDTEPEGCLSFPGVFGRVPRAPWVEVEYQDAKGFTKVRKFTGIDSILFQHEYDHLDQVLFIDKFNPSDREKNKQVLSKLLMGFRAS